MEQKIGVNGRVYNVYKEGEFMGINMGYAEHNGEHILADPNQNEEVAREEIKPLVELGRAIRKVRTAESGFPQ